MSQAGFPVSRKTFFNSVEMLAKELKVKFGENTSPGRKWMRFFQTRHPGLNLRVGRNFFYRNEATLSNISAWFKETEMYIKGRLMEEVIKKAARVFSAGDTSSYFDLRPGKMLTEKGAKGAYNPAGGSKKQILTVLMTANASGQMASPMITYRLNELPKVILETAPSGWAVGKSNNGRVTSDHFYGYMTGSFLPWLKKQGIPRPVIFFMNGHTSTISLPLSMFCREQGTELVGLLYPNSVRGCVLFSEGMLGAKSSRVHIGQ